MATVGLLPPGEMGAFLGRAVLVSGQEVVLWVGAGPSDATRRRAAAFPRSPTWTSWRAGPNGSWWRAALPWSRWCLPDPKPARRRWFSSRRDGRG